MTVTAQSVELRSIAQRVADALPLTVEEVVLTGVCRAESRTTSPT